MRKSYCQTTADYLGYFFGLILLAACTAQPVSGTVENKTGIPRTQPTQTSQPPTTSPPTPPLSPTDTPFPEITVYNRYVGKDLARQPEPIRQAPTEIIAVKDAVGYAGSYVDTVLHGKMVGGEDILGDPEMLASLIKLFDAIRQAGFVSHTVYSSYRSYEDQEYLYQKYGSEYPEVETTLFAAEPGRSEHQLGTVFDMGWSGDLFGFYYLYNVPAAARLNDWLHENAHLYGFVLSFPFKSSEDGAHSNVIETWMTEYKAEPWHWRYVGVELATLIFNTRDDQGRNYLDPFSLLIPQQFFLP